jgi:hypothetical protein
MWILNLLPVALAALGLILRWYQFAPAKQQAEMGVARVNAKKSIVKTIVKQPNVELLGQVPPKARKTIEYRRDGVSLSGMPK